MSKEQIFSEQNFPTEKESLFLLTQPLAETLITAHSSLPEGRVAVMPIDLIWALSTGKESKGNKIIRAMARNEYFRFLDEVEQVRKESQERGNMTELNISGQTIFLEQSTVGLISRAKEIAEVKAVGTDHLVLSEAEREDSLLASLLSSVGILGSIRDGIQGLAEIIEYKETGSVKSIIAGLDYSQVENKPVLDVRGEIEHLPKPMVYDLLTEAKEGKFKDLFFRPELARKLLLNLISQEVVIIVADPPEEGDIIMKGLASQLAENETNKKGLLEFRKILIVDPVSLETDPEGAMNRVTTAKEGIFYLSRFNRALGQILSGELSGGRALKVAIARQQKIILTMTPAQWKEWSKKDFFNQIRNPIFVEPATIEETRKFMETIREKLQEKLGCQISLEAIKQAAKIADQYLKLDFGAPSGAIKLLEWAAGEVSIRSSKMVLLHDQKVTPDMKIDPEDITHALKVMRGIEIIPEDKKRYLEMESTIGERIIGQDETVRELSATIRRAKAGMKDPKKPIASFIFMGPSGVGKTEMAKALAEFLFGDEQALIPVDMSEYQEPHTVSKLIGAPPGYVGYYEGGRLTEPLRKKPYSIILFDELEKAHPEVLNIFLQMLEEGRLTDGQGNRIDLRNTVIIATGNVGSIYFSLGDEVSREEKVLAVLEKVKRTFRPEFLNRFDGILVFNSLTEENLEAIGRLQIKKLNKLLAEQNLSVEVSPETLSYLAKKDYLPEYGARHLQRVIQKEIVNPLAQAILSGEYQPEDKIRTDLKEGKIVFEKTPKNQQNSL